MDLRQDVELTAADGSRVGRPAIEAHQLRRLSRLIAALIVDNPFYRDKLGGAGADADLEDLAAFTARVPFTSKQELVADQAAHPPFGTNLTYPFDRYSRFNQTSGTTSRPIRWLDTPQTWQWVIACWSRVFAAGGVDSRDRIFFPFSFGPFLGFWAAFDAATQLGCLAIPGGGMSSATRLRTIIDNEVTVVCATPTYAIRLAEVAAEEQIDLSRARVRRIIVAGEQGGSIPATRAHIERLWPTAKVVDHHGMTEMGPVSYACPSRPDVLHVMEAAYFPEVIDPVTARAVERGETGELVLTNLGRVGSPLLRYRTGDIVRRAAQVRCACGSEELALEGGILGRADDMVIVRGVNVFPSAVEAILRGDGGVGEFRVEIASSATLTEMVVQVEPTGESVDATALTRRVAAALRDAFALRIAVVCAERGSLPRFEAKAKRWIKL